MKNIRKFLAILLIGCGMITFLAGCGNSKEKEIVNTLIEEQCEKLAAEYPPPFYDGKFDPSKVKKISDHEWQYVVTIGAFIGQIDCIITVRRAGNTYRSTIRKNGRM